MNVVLSLMQRDQWAAQKCGFGRRPTKFILLFTQAVPRIYSYAPSLSQAFDARKKSRINLGVNYQDSGLWWVLQQIISLPYQVTSHWWYCCDGIVATVTTQVWILVTAPFCCDRKSRAACAQSFAPWQQATIEITRRDHSRRHR